MTEIISMKNKRVLVTGGAGFIGSHLVNALVGADAEVTVIDDLSAGKQDNVNSKARFYKIDMGDAGVEKIFQETKPEYVFHLAFNTDAPKSVREPEFDALSIVGSVNIFHQCVLRGVKKIVFPSSGFIYGNAKVRPTPESEPPFPSSPYSVSKIASEYYLKYFNINFGLPYTIVRFSTVFGPRQNGRAMGHYIDSIKEGKPGNIWGDGTKTRDYIYIDDAVEGLMKALAFADSGSDPIFNISSGKETSLNELYATLAKLLGHPENHPTYLPDRPGEIVKFSLDASKANHYLQWEPKVSFEDGIKQTIENYLKK